jgi:hypothetical protein
MNISTFNFYKKEIENYKKNQYTLEDSTKIAHILCTASRLSKYGFSGSAHGNWISGIMMGGVWYCAKNYDVRILYASNPNAKWIAGCQNSCAHGDIMPKFNDKDCKLLNYYEAPTIIQDKIDEIMLNINKHIVEVIEKQVIVFENQIKNNNKKKNDFEKQTLDNWTK